MKKVKQWIKDHDDLVLEVVIVGGFAIFAGGMAWKRHQKFMVQMDQMADSAKDELRHFVDLEALEEAAFAKELQKLEQKAKTKTKKVA